MEIANLDTAQVLIYLMQQIPSEEPTPFSRISTGEVSQRDNLFISKMMTFDWRERATAKELLDDEWWEDEAE